MFTPTFSKPTSSKIGTLIISQSPAGAACADDNLRGKTITHISGFSRLRYVKMTCALCIASCLQAANPRPSVPPVTRMTLPVRSGMSFSVQSSPSKSILGLIRVTQCVSKFKAVIARCYSKIAESTSELRDMMIFKGRFPYPVLRRGLCQNFLPLIGHWPSPSRCNRQHLIFVYPADRPDKYRCSHLCCPARTTMRLTAAATGVSQLCTSLLRLRLVP